MELPLQLSVSLSSAPDLKPKIITIHEGATIIVGSNGAGKTQLLRGIKNSLENQYRNRIQYLASGRLSPVEEYRSNVTGRNSGLAYENANYGPIQYRAARRKSETIYGTLHTLNIRPDLQIKVSERLQRFFGRDIFLEWEAGNLKAKFTDLNTAKGYSSAREASGLLQLVVLLTALYNDEVKVLLIDEPEVSLHPQLQTFLLREINEVAGHASKKGQKLIIYSTHSTHMINLRKARDISKIIFCNSIHEPIYQISMKADELKGKKLQEFITRIGQQYKLAFFCKYPILVEGETEVIICNGLDLKLNLYLEAGNAQIVPVIGKGQFPVVAKFMRLIGKTPVILTDADGLTDSTKIANIFSQLEMEIDAANNYGHRDLSSFLRDVHGDFCKQIESRWSEIEDKAVLHPYYVHRESSNKDETTIKRRAAFATLMSMTPQERSNLDNDWERLYSRICALLNTLEQYGCFILRRGTIESYYNSSVDFHNKPASAIEEVNFIHDHPSIETIKSNYSDVLRALQYAVQTPQLDEVRAVETNGKIDRYVGSILGSSIMFLGSYEMETGGLENRYTI
ncbi:MAG: ATP-dependent nuclease, partial [Aggregatilineales bacterium]